MDARTVRQAVPELQYLRCFLLYLQWGRNADPQYEFWFDDFAIEGQGNDHHIQNPVCD